VILLLVFGIAYQTMGFEHYCSYVGTKGCAIFTCSGQRRNIVNEQTLVFQEAYDEGVDLRVHTTHVIVNGSYSHTNYGYIWTNRDRKEVFTVGGTHNAHNDSPPSGSSYHLAEDAERTWSIFLLGKILPLLKSGG